jgi:predicted nucleic acid-binding protein
VVSGELRTRFRLGRRSGRNEREIAAFLANPAVCVLEVDEEASGIFAELVADLRRRGTPAPTNDAWIAALAVREGAVILTYDEHFKLFGRAGVILLEPGSTA